MQYSSIEKFLEDTIGLDANAIGKNILHRSVDVRMDQTGQSDAGNYLKLLKTSPAEIDQLIEQVIVPETWFFRDVEPFIFLKNHIETSRLPMKQSGLLKVLSVPCSTGEEPYSIAITLLEAGLKPENFKIDAVDICKKSLKQAQQAQYDKRAFRGKGVHYQNKYIQNTQEEFRIDKRITGLVQFHYDNLLHPDFLANHAEYHIIFCRNLLIYFTGKAREKILTGLDRLLVDDGLLFTGHSELLFFRQNGYAKVKHPRSFACQKSGQGKQADVSKYIAKKPLKLSSSSVRRRKRKPLNPPQHVPEKEVKQPEKKLASALSDIRALSDRGDIEKAFALCEKYLEVNNANAEAHYVMGVICHAGNRLGKAEEHFLKSIYLDPNHYEALIHLSLLYEQKGDTAGSALYKKRAKRLHELEKGTVPTTA